MVVYKGNAEAVESRFNNCEGCENHLCNSFELAEVSRRDNRAVCACCNEAHGCDSELAENYDGGSHNEARTVDFIVAVHSIDSRHIAKAKERCHYHEFICQRVEKLAKVCYKAVFAGYIAVKEICKSRRHVDYSGYNEAPDAEAEIAKIENHENWNEENAEKT